MEEENMWETPLLVLSFFLFVFEIFLGMTTLLVSLGARSLPYKDMVGLRNFVVFAGLTITTSSMVVPSDLWVVETLLAAHHFYLYITWDVSDYSKKVIFFFFRLQLNWIWWQFPCISCILLCSFYDFGVSSMILSNSLFSAVVIEIIAAVNCLLTGSLVELFELY